MEKAFVVMVIGFVLSAPCSVNKSRLKKRFSAHGL